MEKERKKFLVVKTHAIGDLLLITPSIRALKKAYPRGEVHVLTGRIAAPILYQNPYIDRIIQVNEKALLSRSLGEFFYTIRRISKQKYRAAFIFQQSTAVRLMVRLGGAKSIYSLDSSWRDKNKPGRIPWVPNANRYVADSFLDLVRAYGVKDDGLKLDLDLMPSEYKDACELFSSSTKSLSIGVFPGGGNNPRDRVSAKQWHPERFAEMIRRLHESVNCRIYLIGGASDEHILQAVADQAPDAVFRVVSNLDLRQLIAGISQLDLVITNDSAPLHIAIALEIPFVAIFAPTNPRALLPPQLVHWAVAPQVECSPCYSNQPFPGCENPGRCMSAVSVQMVMDKVLARIEEMSVN